jgi:hypothetical protein
MATGTTLAAGALVSRPHSSPPDRLRKNPAGGYTPIATTVSGTDGIYYFKNIQLGNFVLQVNETNYPLVVRGLPS